MTTDPELLDRHAYALAGLVAREVERLAAVAPLELRARMAEHLRHAATVLHPPAAMVRMRARVEPAPRPHARPVLRVLEGGEG